MRLLTAVNLILPRLKEHPVSSLAIKHPTLAVLLPEVEQELRALLLKGWWFNQFEYTAIPNNEGAITLGADTLSFVPTDGHYTALRGLQLFDVTTMSFVWTESVKGIVTQYVDFDNIPESAAQFVFNSALVKIYTTDLGVGDDLRVWSNTADKANQELLNEHLRQRRYSSSKSARFQRLRRAMRA